MYTLFHQPPTAHYPDAAHRRLAAAFSLIISMLMAFSACLSIVWMECVMTHPSRQLSTLPAAVHDAVQKFDCIGWVVLPAIMHVTVFHLYMSATELMPLLLMTAWYHAWLVLAAAHS